MRGTPARERTAMRLSMRHLPALLVLGMLSACAVAGWRLPLARAQEDANLESAEYRRWIDTAIAEYAEGNFEEAHALFERAHALSPTARTYRGLGMMAFELRRYVDSIEHLEAALRCAEKPLEGELRSATAQLLERAHEYVGLLRIHLEPRTARASIDGLPVPLPWADGIWVRVGEHDLRVHADGYEPEHRTFAVRGREQLRVEVTLRALASPNSQTAGHDLAPNHRRAWYKSPWLWSAAAVVVVGAATTAVLLTRSGERGTEPYRGSAEVELTGPPR